MKSLSAKFKLIFLPFLVLAVCFICGYSFLNWLFVIKLQIPLDEEVANLWLPMLLPWIPVYFYLRPKIKLLGLKSKKRDGHFLYVFMAAFAISIPAIIAQMFLLTATGKLTKLQNISQISEHPATKYYELKDYYIDKDHGSVYRTAKASGRNNEYLNLCIYVVCPVLNKPTDSIKPAAKPDTKKYAYHYPDNALLLVNGRATTKEALSKLNPKYIDRVSVLKPGAAATALYGEPAKYGVILISIKELPKIVETPRQLPLAWLGIKYNRQISNSLSSEAKEDNFTEFDIEMQKRFKVESLDNFVYLDRIKNNEDYKGFKAAVANVPGYKGEVPIIFEAKNESFAARNGSKLGWIFKSFGIGCAIWLIMLLFPPISEPEKLTKKDWLEEWNKFTKLILSVNVSNPYFVAIVIGGINVLIYVVMVFAGLGVVSFESHDLYNWGANSRPAVLDGQWWRLFSGMFLHGGLMHLAGNLYGLIFASLLLEPLIGKAKYLTAYLICGLMASLSSILWHPDTISVGASGAIFGLFGVMFVLLIANKTDPVRRRFFLINSSIFIGFNLLAGIRGNIDNAAHIGGLLTGLVIGVIYTFFIEHHDPHLEDADNLPVSDVVSNED
jgi:rhomboid protease GluP